MINISTSTNTNLMGAIWLMIYDPNRSSTNINIEMTNRFMEMKNRGKDDTSYFVETTTPITAANMNAARLYLSKRELASYSPLTFMYGFHRMSINDLSLDGSQPFVDPIPSMMLKYPELKVRPTRKLLCTGEIYNWRELVEANNFGERDLCSRSDVEVMLPLYIQNGIDGMLEVLDGDFAFVLMDNVGTYNLSQTRVYVGRDPLGLRTLYMIRRARDDETFWMFVSELKGVPRKILGDKSYSVTEVPPGSYWSYSAGDFVRYSKLGDIGEYKIKTADPDVLVGVYSRMRDLITRNVMSRYNSVEVGVGVGILLSGGFNSSLIASIVVGSLVGGGHDFDKNPVHVFTVGDANSDDVMSACACVSFLESKWGIDLYHHIVTQKGYEVQMEEIARELVYILETEDADVIGASVPTYLMYKYISENTGVRVVLSGEGLGKIFRINAGGSYDTKAFLDDLSRKRLDCLGGFFGVEARYPFLEVDFINYVLGIDPKLKAPQVSGYGKERIDKYLVRKAFDTGDYLEASTLWRVSGGIEDAVSFSASLSKSQISDEYHKYFG